MSLWRAVAGAAVVALAGAGLTGCTAQPVEASLCPGAVELVEVFNYYRDHPGADYHQLDDPVEITGNCDDVWNHLVLEPRQFPDADLAQRSVTVLDLHLAAGGGRTIWVHRLPGFDAGAAVLYDTGESYYLRRPVPPPYYAAHAEPIDRDQVPVR